jgi:hypothetical protein
MKKADAGQPVKDPEADYRSSLYPFPGGGYGFPALAFKSAAVDACSQLTGLTKVQTRGAFHVIGTQTDDGQLVKIEGAPRMREDMVRLNGTTADIRYRAEFPTWKTTLSIHYNHGVFSDEQIVNLFNVAGFAVGIGEWRPARDGNWGMFQVAARKGKQG